MSEIKVGDRVRVVKSTLYTAPEGGRYLGKVGVIVHIDTSFTRAYKPVFPGIIPNIRFAAEELEVINSPRRSRKDIIRQLRKDKREAVQEILRLRKVYQELVKKYDEALYSNERIRDSVMRLVNNLKTYHGKRKCLWSQSLKRRAKDEQNKSR